MSKIHLICNAHIDPVWLWNWEEGLAETLATFRVAVRFCKKFPGFVFCHNESLLYEWVEEHEPELFREIKRLVAAGKWKVIGGWYLQPDCNLPSGESFIRQIRTGKQFFRDRFGVNPTTAVNFDSFGHSRGLVQILKKSGYDSYLFCRPGLPHLEVPDDFSWIGFDGSRILAHRSLEHYNSERGKAGTKLELWLTAHSENKPGIFLWGIGNHGGGPSEEDLIKIEEIRIKIEEIRLKIEEIGKKKEDIGLIGHSWPENYFEEISGFREELPEYKKDLNPWAVGCYTSMSNVKKLHRQLEESLRSAEVIAAHASLSGRMKYPESDLEQAERDLLFCEFHDILPGSGIPEVESLAVRKLHHGLEIADRIRIKAFFRLVAGERGARPEEFPILIYNPEPVEVCEIHVIELQGPEPNFNSDIFLMPVLTDESGANIPVQLEKESANISNDHRKRIVFKTTLNPSGITRLSCYLTGIPAYNKPGQPVQADLIWNFGENEVRISEETGLIDRMRIGGIDCLRPGSAELLVLMDDADPWGMKVDSFRNVCGRFRLMTPQEAGQSAGTAGPIHPVRIIEHGPVRTVVEALFRYNRSEAVVTYFIPSGLDYIEVGVRVFWLEKDRMLKLSLPTQLRTASCKGQVAFGVQEFDREGEELIAHQWVGLFGTDHAFTVVNQTSYGFDYNDGELRLSLLRSPAYAGHPVGEGIPIVRQDRFTPRMDQGEHLFRFRLNAGTPQDRLSQVDREARHLNAPVTGLCCFPPKKRQKPLPAIQIDDPAIQLSSMCLFDRGTRLRIHLFETTGQPRQVTCILPSLGLKWQTDMGAFEIQAFLIDLKSGKITNSNNFG